MFDKMRTNTRLNCVTYAGMQQLLAAKIKEDGGFTKFAELHSGELYNIITSNRDAVVLGTLVDAIERPYEQASADCLQVLRWWAETNGLAPMLVFFDPEFPGTGIAVKKPTINPVEEDC